MNTNLKPDKAYHLLDNNTVVEIPSQFSHNLKLEETAKGVRISVHGYGTNGLDVVIDTIAMYKTTRDKLINDDIPIAPMELKQ